MRLYFEKEVADFRNLSTLSVSFIAIKLGLVLSVVYLFSVFFPHALEMKSAEETDLSSLGGILSYIFINGSIETTVICVLVYICYHDDGNTWFSIIAPMILIGLGFMFLTRSVGVVVVVCLETILCSILFFKAGGAYGKSARAYIVVLFCNLAFNGSLAIIGNL
jgi:hypothetical protein